MMALRLENRSQPEAKTSASGLKTFELRAAWSEPASVSDESDTVTAREANPFHCTTLRRNTPGRNPFRPLAEAGHGLRDGDTYYSV